MEQKRVSFKVAKAIKEAGYPQWSVEGADNTKLAYDCVGEMWEIRYFDQNPQDYYTAPTYLDVWLWLWREKKITIDIVGGIEFRIHITDNFIGGCGDNPEEAIIKAIEYLVDNNLIK